MARRNGVIRPVIQQQGVGGSSLALRDLLRIDADNPPLVRAQAQAMARQLPLMYAILGANSALLGYSFFGRAPNVLAVYLPLALCILCAARGWAWWRSRKKPEPKLAVTVALLKKTVWFSLVLGLGCSAWALSLAHYGDLVAQGYVLFYMSITVIGCVFCLTHVPAAALTLTIAVMCPFFLALFAKGGESLALISVNAALVFAALFVVLASNFRDFTRLIQSRETLISGQQETERLHLENLRLANLDLLTGLPSRRPFFEGLKAWLEGDHIPGQHVAVALVDLDGFKAVNDVYGHSYGDQVLVEAAIRLRRHTSEGAAARLGGDEFAVLLNGFSTDDALMAWGRSVCAALSEPYLVEGVTIRLSGSVGLSALGERGVSTEGLVERADYALYSAKREHPGRPAIFSGEHEKELRRYAMISQGLRAPAIADELTVAFQPLVDSHSGRTVAFEALARWNNPALGQVAPQEFIDIAERLGIVSRLTIILLEKTLAQVCTWPADLRISFNISTQDLISGEALQEIVDTVGNSGVAPGRIDFEVTETALLRDFDKAAAALQRLKSLGCGISLDDFGTGHSSLSYVHRLPLDKIKIDRTFVQDLAGSRTAGGIVKTIVDMSRNLGIECIVEGVETESQLLRLRQFGCRVMQGYLFSRPMPGGDVHAFVQKAASDQREQASLQLALGDSPHRSSPVFQSIPYAASIP